MRPLLVVVNLAVLITNAHAIKCLSSVNESSVQIDCEEIRDALKPEQRDRIDTSKCIKFDGNVKGEHLEVRTCGIEGVCNTKGFYCCDDKDYCNGAVTPSNGAVTSPPSVLQLTAVVASAIAALGI
ncbi:hypothetical protein AAVH_08973 [Aphelenchoides avenae]|nr:hypothetical protein AAVH_08973 [Aphelenchus avenae]